MRTLAILLVTLLAVAPAMAQDYRTVEFRSGDSHLAVAYMCGVMGQKTGVAPDAMQVVAVAVADGLSAEHSGNLLADALDWWELEGERMAAIGMWDQFCEQPINNFRRLNAQ